MFIFNLYRTISEYRVRMLNNLKDIEQVNHIYLLEFT